MLAAAVFAVAEVLPAAGTWVAGLAGALLVAACALAPVRGAGDPLGLTVFGLGAVLLAAALASIDAGPVTTAVEALLAAAAGLLFAWAFAVPAALLAVPLLVAGVDLAAALGGGADPLVVVEPASVLTLDLPAWGRDGTVARLGLLDATFLAMWAGWALRFDLRPRLAAGLMTLGLGAAVAVGLAADRAVPALPFVAAGFLVAVGPRLVRLLRSEG